MAASMNCVLSKKIKSFALCSRLFLICFQVLFNLIIPDHDAKVFNPPTDDSEHTGVCDNVVQFLFSGLRRWDGIYFTHIAQHGYTYENTLAFFPLYPYAIHITANYLLYPFHFILNTSSLYLIGSLSINVFLFVKTAEYLFTLGQCILKNDTIAYKAALLFCINPASVFMTAPYSEILYFCLCVQGLVKLETNHPYMASALFGLCGTTRSNGLLCMGFVAFKKAQEMVITLKNLKKGLTADMSAFFVTLWIMFILYLIPFLVCLSLCVLPFIVYQYYCYWLYCTWDSPVKLPEYLVQYGRSQGLKVLGEEPSTWCTDNVPMSYSYIQRHYWDQGFLNYWQLKQTPNFCLALPVFVLMMLAAVSYYRHNRYTCHTLGLDVDGATKRCPPSHRVYHLSGPCLMPYIVHPVLLLMFGWFCIHVQVLTRLLFSTAPVLYWYSACLVSMDTPPQPQVNKYDVFKSRRLPVETKQNMEKRTSNLLIDQIMTFKIQPLFTKLVIAYYIGYFVIGTALFSNFLPWT